MEWNFNDLLRAHKSFKSLEAHHTQTMDHFARHSITQIVKPMFPLEVVQDANSIRLSIDNIRVTEPLDLQGKESHVQMCKNKGTTFLFGVEVEATLESKIDGTERLSSETIVLCYLPAMVGVYPCKDRDMYLKYPGFFLINGNEKCVVTQETMVINFPVVTQKLPEVFVVSARCHKPKSYKSSNTVSFTYNKPKGTIVCAWPCPVNLAFCAIVKKLQLTPDSLPALRGTPLFDLVFPAEYTPIDNEEEELAILLPYLFSHCKEDDLVQKREFLVLLLLRLHEHVSLGTEDSIDDLRFKCLIPPGLSYANLFRQRASTFIKSLKYIFEKQLAKKTHPRCKKIFPENNNLTASVHYAFATGNWGANTVVSNSFGVTQIINRTNADHMSSQMVIVNTPLNRDGKVPAPRRIHLSHYGLLCASETPEGRSTGLINSLAHFTFINYEIDLELLCSVLHTSGKALWDPLGPVRVFCSGVYLGRVQDVEEYLDHFEALKRHCDIPFTLGVEHFPTLSVLQVAASPGRLTRPLFKAQDLGKVRECLRNNVENHLWIDLILSGAIVYVSKDSERDLFIGADVRRAEEVYTHYEIDPCLYLHNEMGNKIVYSNHNKAPRNIYQTNMGKQAIGCVYPDEAYHSNTENKQHYMDYPQRPLVSTRAHALADVENSLTGVNVIVAIMCYSGYNQEDSLIVNKAAVERGLFQSTYIRVQESKEHRSGYNQDVFVPAQVTGDRRKKTICSSASYKHVQDDYVPNIGDKVQPGDVIIHKVRKENAKNCKVVNDHLIKDCSITADIVEECVVNKVLVGSDNDNNGFAKVYLMASRKPIQGDKLSSRHGQKGIIGRVEEDVNLPRTAEGVVPDIIVNCHAIPSRMTIGQILESVHSKLALFNGKFVDGTAFESHQEIFEITRQLMEKSKGQADRYGEEVLYCGKTGIMLKNRAFVGCAYYQRLKHFVVDKIHSRSTGTVDILTKQPLEGRSKKGGLRLGEMERDALISHGASSTLAERMLRSSDLLEAYICNKCGLFSDTPHIDGMKSFCRNCKSQEHTEWVEVPYAYKLLVQELACVHVGLRHTVQKNSEWEGVEN